MVNNEDKDMIHHVLTFWEKIKPKEQELILSHAINVKYRQGERIHSSGNDCAGVLIIKRGRLRVYILSEEGREITLYRLDQKDVCVLSASCILKNITFDVHIDAEEFSEIILVNSDAIDKISKNIYVENFMLNEAVTRFSDVMWAMEQILFLKFDQRLAIFLLDETSRDKSIIITRTHEQIARHLGSAREVVSRMLKYFAKEGFVELSRGEVRVINKNELRKII